MRIHLSNDTDWDSGSEAVSAVINFRVHFPEYSIKVQILSGWPSHGVKLLLGRETAAILMRCDDDNSERTDGRRDDSLVATGEALMGKLEFEEVWCRCVCALAVWFRESRKILSIHVQAHMYYRSDLGTINTNTKAAKSHSCNLVAFRWRSI